MPERLPVCEPHFWGNEKRYVVDALDTGWISSAGDYLTKFEQAFARACGVDHGIGVFNGTVALHLGLLAAGVKPGDEVIVGDFTMMSPVFAVLYCGAKPVFVDAEADTWCMDTAAIEKKITPRTRAILAVHIYGHPCDMDAINTVAKKHGLAVIEDAAEAHGALVRGKVVGGLSDVACFSFYANKIVTTGEGGMVVTNRGDLAAHLRAHKNLCFGQGLQRFVHEDVGFQYRMTNIQAAIGLGQVEHLGAAVERKRTIAKAYDSLLAGVPGLTLPVEKPWAKNVYWVYGILVDPDFGMTRDQLAAKLAEQGIETRPFFVGMHLQPVLREHLVPGEAFPVSKRLGETGLYLPSFMHMKDSDIERVAAAVKSLQKRR